MCRVGFVSIELRVRAYDGYKTVRFFLSLLFTKKLSFFTFLPKKKKKKHDVRKNEIRKYTDDSHYVSQTVGTVDADRVCIKQ